ncbi:carboxypeptidase M32 [Acetobacteraceae bacterium KSS8]|uniref:Metal-dependent carboxypeptidase n=1 Tax=Endosaccharibacter trunci TaxID=2812733 RepID=A0ABT1W4J5_9PROT|nr:carboxypeptidase M32 [Acetobacteraceae bacterium KSS8]
MTAYTKLEQRFTRLSRLSDALGILGWDKETTMPLGAAETRGEVIATLSVMAHTLLTETETTELLAAANAEQDALGVWQRANLREMRRQHAHATAVPADLVEAAARASTACEVRWRRARGENDFSGLRPDLQWVLDTQREIGQAKGEALGLSPYDALLDQFDPGTTQTFIDPIFAEIGAALPELVGRAMEQQDSRPEPTPMDGPFPIAAQKALGEKLMRAIGFDFERGRLDISTHPFCGGASQDVRITTRYDENDFSSALMGVLHETGHALYEQGRPADFLAQPVGQARGMSLHESQSLLIEMQVCRSDAFLRFLSPLLCQTFGDQPAFEAHNLAAFLRRVEPGLIRVDADEVTYPAHIMLRYALEKAMISGDLALADLPAAFNDGMQRSLGVCVPDDASGCMQDVHWPAGLFGYFPTYSLGAMTAAQLMQAARGALPALDASIENGEFGALVSWLRDAVHGRGSVGETPAIIAEATGGPLDPSIYLSHLRRRYLRD